MLGFDKRELAKALLPRALVYVLAFVLFIVAQAVLVGALSPASPVEAQPSATDERARTRALETIADELGRIRRLMEARDRRERNGG